MEADLLIHNIGQLATVAGPPGPRRGAAMREIGLMRDAAVVIAGGRVLAVGPARELSQRVQPRRTLDAAGRAVVPGFVDAHTHLPWAGERAAEFEMRIGGATYMQIMAAGGGISRTVQTTRSATREQLLASTRGRLDRMLRFGTTTAEAKTGYGLDTANELKQLEVIAELQRQGPVDLAPTFLAAHAVPPEYAGRTDEYVDLIVSEMLPAAAKRWAELREDFPPGWPLFCDVFCEPGAFDLGQTRRILEAGRALGMRLKAHVDEFASLGGVPLAVELGAVSVDHLVATPAEHLALLAASDVVAVALPGTPFGLAERDYTPARELIEMGAALALGSDLNPGTCWCESIQFIIALACRYLRLLPAEALVAATINAAYAVGLGDRAGSVEPGKLADLVILDTEDYRDLGYRFGTNLAAFVVKRGAVFGGAPL